MRQEHEEYLFAQKMEGWYRLLKNGAVIKVTKEETPELYRMVEAAIGGLDTTSPSAKM